LSLLGEKKVGGRASIEMSTIFFLLNWGGGGAMTSFHFKGEERRRGSMRKIGFYEIGRRVKVN